MPKNTCRDVRAEEQKLLADNKEEVTRVGDDDGDDDAEDGMQSTMHDVTEIVYEYAENCSWWKENFREGAIDSLEDKTVPTLVTALWKHSYNSGKCSIQLLKDFKKLATSSQVTDMANEVTAALLQSQADSSSSTIEEAAKQDLKVLSNMLKFLEVLRKAEHMQKSDGAILSMKQVYDSFAENVGAALRDKNVESWMIDQAMEVPKLLVQEPRMVDKCLVEKDVLLKEIESLTAVTSKIASFRQGVANLQTAASQNKGNQSCEAIKEGVFTLHSSIKSARNLIEKPPKFSEASSYVKHVTHMLTLCDGWITQGGNNNNGSQGVLKEYCISLLKDVMKKLNTDADLLKEIAGGKDKGQSWKDPLRVSSSWAKITELWTQVLSKCDCKKVDEQLVSLKEDRRANCMHAACTHGSNC